MSIRAATNLDREPIRTVYRSAFSGAEQQLVSRLAVDLLAGHTAPITISLVAESENLLIGHTAFSPIRIENHGHAQGYILAPLAVARDCQGKKIGSSLIERGLEQLTSMGVDIIFVYGDPAYYSRFGFDAGIAAPFIPPYRLTYPLGWQGIALDKSKIAGVSGTIECVVPLRDPALW